MNSEFVQLLHWKHERPFSNFLNSNNPPWKDTSRIAVIRFVTDIVNRSPSDISFPSTWKESEVLSVLKDGNHEIPRDSQPLLHLPSDLRVSNSQPTNEVHHK